MLILCADVGFLRAIAHQFNPSIQRCWTLLNERSHTPRFRLKHHSSTGASNGLTLATTKFDRNRFLLSDSLGWPTAHQSCYRFSIIAFLCILVFLACTHARNKQHKCPNLLFCCCSDLFSKVTWFHTFIQITTNTLHGTGKNRTCTD